MPQQTSVTLDKYDRCDTVDTEVDNSDELVGLLLLL